MTASKRHHPNSMAKCLSPLRQTEWRTQWRCPWERREKETCVKTERPLPLTACTLKALRQSRVLEAETKEERSEGNTNTSLVKDRGETRDDTPGRWKTRGRRESREERDREMYRDRETDRAGSLPLQKRPEDTKEMMNKRDRDRHTHRDSPT